MSAVNPTGAGGAPAYYPSENLNDNQGTSDQLDSYSPPEESKAAPLTWGSISSGILKIFGSVLGGSWGCTYQENKAASYPTPSSTSPLEAAPSTNAPAAKETDTIVSSEVQNKGRATSKTVRVNGQVMSEGKSVSGATVLLTRIAEGIVKRTTTDSFGIFKFDVKPIQYTLVVFSDAYLLDAMEYNPYLSAIPYNFNLIPRPKESTIEVRPNEIVLKQKIDFKRNDKDQPTIYISEESDVVLREVAEVILKNPQFKEIEIRGHNGEPDDPPWDKLLSKDRARAVLRRLVTLGVSLLKLKARGYGFDQPLVPGTSAAARKTNERIEIIVLE